MPGGPRCRPLALARVDVNRLVRWIVDEVAATKRASYQDSRPGLLMRRLNRLDALTYGSGVLAPRHGATLEVVGRRSGRTVDLPVAVVDLGGSDYLVSMLGPDANWVHNVRAANGRAVLRRRVRRRVLLTEVPYDERPPVLRRYLAVAPGARPHFPVDWRAPLTDFVPIAHCYPVFRITEPRAGNHRASSGGAGTMITNKHGNPRSGAGRDER